MKILLVLKKILRPWYHFLKNCIRVIKKAIVYPCRFLPLQNKIVFINFFGRGLGDDPKYILLELLKRGVDAEMVWVSNNRHEKVPEGVKVVKYKSFMAHYHWYTACVWVDNCKSTYRPMKRMGQFYLQTWHATLPLKKVEREVEDYLTKRYKAVSIRESLTIDLMYANNNVQLNMFKNTFWYNGPVLKCDVPREVPLLQKDSSIKDDVYNFWGIDKRKKMILYAPTFRKDYSIDIYVWDYQRVIKAIERKFKSDFVMILRLHPNIAQKCNEITYGDNIINGSRYPDMQELLAASDIMINDYSSTQFEFAMMRKPVFLFCPDIVNYRKNDRPWVFEPEELPYTYATNIEGLEKNIYDFDDEEYQEKCELFLNKIGFEDQGNGDKVIADIVMKHLMQFKNGEC